MFKRNNEGEFVRTKSIETKMVNAPWSGRTQSGYGRNLPTDRMIQTEPKGPYRRVYVACFSNVGSAYVRIKGERVLLDSEI